MDDKPEPEIIEKKESEISRREIVKWLILAGSLLPTALGGVYLLFRYLLPEVVIHEKRFRLAKVSEITPEGIEARVKGTTFVVVKQGDRVRAFSTVCTHLGCKVIWKPELPGFHCPCHDGYFDENAQVTGGPPPSALEEYPIDIEKDEVYIRLVLS